jgi:hypothetical protein
MPYVTEQIRDELLARMPEAAGELNYEITGLINIYIKEKGLNYQTINDVLGVLEGAKLELYRRVAAPYEDTKIAQNGDVGYPEV